MSKLILSSVCWLLFLINIGETQENNWYVGIEGGYSLLGREKSVGNILDLNVNFKDSVVFGGILGYDYGDYRIEGEIGKHLHSVDRFNIINDGGLGLGGLGDQAATSGKANHSRFMLNIVYDLQKIPNFQNIEPFVGTGVGYSNIKWNNFSTSTATFANDSDNVFSYHIFAGARRSVTKRIEMQLKYRYFRSIGVDMVDRLNNKFDTSYGTHDFMFSLIYRFGETHSNSPKRTPESKSTSLAAPNSAIPPITTPTKPVIKKDITYKIYYEWDSSEIDEEGQVTIENAASDVKKGEYAIIELDGHADRSGPDKYNEDLSMERALIVERALIAEGISASMISVEAHGERDPELDTLDGMRERRNRRVVILIK